MRTQKAVECLKAFLEVVLMQNEILDDAARTEANQTALREITGFEDYVYEPSRGHTKFFLSVSVTWSDVFSSYKRLNSVKKYFYVYPWRGRISREEHFQHGTILLTNEVYTFQERIIWYMEEAANFRNVFSSPALPIGNVKRRMNREFNYFNRFRGRHVHEFEVRNSAVARIGVLSVLTGATDSEEYRLLEEETYRNAKRVWQKRAEDAITCADNILEEVAEITEPLWQHASRVSQSVVSGRNKHQNPEGKGERVDGDLPEDE